MISLTSSDRVLIVAPHPDDESLATGGLIQRIAASGARMRVLFLTSGENNPWPQRFVERRWRISPHDRARWGKARRAEAVAALEALGAERNAAHFLHLPDQGLTRLLMQGGRSVIAVIAEELAHFHPTLVVGPSGSDTHPDHSAAHVLLQLALRENGAAGIRYLDFIVHGKPFAMTPTSVVLPLPPTELRRKLSAILCHASQTALSRRRFCAYATPRELFHVLEPLRAGHPTHPIHVASVQDDWLNLSVRHSWPVLPARRIFLAIEGEEPARWSLTLPMTSGAVKLTDERRGETHCLAIARRSRGETELRIPLTGVAGRTALFAKLAGSCAFFDQAGWREVPVGKPSALAPAPLHQTAGLQAPVTSLYSRPRPSTASVLNTQRAAALSAIGGTIEAAPSTDSRRLSADPNEQHTILRAGENGRHRPA